MGSDCRIPDLNSGEADGVAKRALIILPPLLCPASVIFEVEPPNEGITWFKKFIALITSFTARLVEPSGDMKPSCMAQGLVTDTDEQGTK